MNFLMLQLRNLTTFSLKCLFIFFYGYTDNTDTMACPVRVRINLGSTVSVFKYTEHDFFLKCK